MKQIINFIKSNNKLFGLALLFSLVASVSACRIPCGPCGDNQVCELGQCVDVEPEAEECEMGQCEECVPQCDGMVCGDDGCGGECGVCGENEACELGQCAAVEAEAEAGEMGEVENDDDADEMGEPECVPQCDGLACGPDGCGGECGVCGENEACELGQCAAVAAEVDEMGEPECVPQCDGLACGPDGCGGECGQCAGNEGCQAGQCACVPSGVDIPGNGIDEDCDGLDLRCEDRPKVNFTIDELRAGSWSSIMISCENLYAGRDGIFGTDDDIYDGNCNYAYIQLDSVENWSFGRDGVYTTSSHATAENLDGIAGFAGLSLDYGRQRIDYRRSRNLNVFNNGPWNPDPNAPDVGSYVDQHAGVLLRYSKSYLGGNGGKAVIKDNGNVVFSVSDLESNLMMYLRNPIGPGAPGTGTTFGYGIGQIDVESSEEEWVSALDPYQQGQVEVTYTRLTPIVQLNWAIYQVELEVKPYHPNCDPENFDADGDGLIDLFDVDDNNDGVID